MTITVQKLADATPAATFWSINNKIARNEKGVLAGFMTSRGGAAYDAQVLKFYYWKDDPAQAQMIRATLPGPFNPPSVVAASTGEFYAFFPDFINNSMYVFYWPDIEANKTPLVTTVGGVSVGGKWSAVFDEARRRVIAIGQSTGKLHFFNDQAVYTGTIEGIRAAGNDARSALQYPALQLCPENRLHIAWCTSDQTAYANNGAVSYRDIGYAWAPDLRNFANFTMPKIGWPGGFTPAPIASDACGVLRTEELDPNTLLSSFLVTRDHVHISYAYINQQSGKFVSRDLRGSTFAYQRYNRLAGKQEAHDWPLRIIEPGSKTDFIPRFPGSHLIEFEQYKELYHVFIDRMQLVVTKWNRPEDKWYVVKRIDIPGYETGPSFIHYITGRGTNNKYNRIDLLVTVINASYDQWANDPAVENVPSKVMYIDIPREDLIEVA